jgi:hypothetical protein
LNAQEKAELAVFQKFAGNSGSYSIQMNSIRGEKPPRADISCVLHDGRPVDFELVDCIDESVAQAGSQCTGLTTSFYDELKKHPDAPRIKGCLKGRGVRTTFVDGATLRRKKKTIKEIVAILSGLRPGYAGDVAVAGRIPLEEVVARIEIVVDRGNSLSFYPVIAESFKDVTVECLAKKFAKHYQTTVQLDLLGYYKGAAAMIPMDTRLETVKQYIKQNIGGSQFNRVWIYSVDHDEVQFVHPLY